MRENLQAAELIAQDERQGNKIARASVLLLASNVCMPWFKSLAENVTRDIYYEYMAGARAFYTDNSRIIAGSCERRFNVLADIAEPAHIVAQKLVANNMIGAHFAAAMFFHCLRL